MSSPALTSAANSNRTEAEVRAIRHRRAALAADLRAEGASEASIIAATSEANVQRLMDYERKTVSHILNLFGAP